MPDIEDYPRGPNGLAALCRDSIAELEAKRDALPRSERKPVNRRLHEVRKLLRFCETRAGYDAAVSERTAPQLAQ